MPGHLMSTFLVVTTERMSQGYAQIGELISHPRSRKFGLDGGASRPGPVTISWWTVPGYLVSFTAASSCTRGLLWRPGRSRVICLKSGAGEGADLPHQGG